MSTVVGAFGQKVDEFFIEFPGLELPRGKNFCLVFVEKFS